MNTLIELKGLLVKSAICEIEALEKGDLKGADCMLRFRHAAYNRVYMIECFRDSYEENKELVDYLVEQAREITFLLINKKF